MKSKASQVETYLQSLPDDRREALETVRRVLRENLDGDYQEGMAYGMIGYSVPLTIFPAGYRNDARTPLPFAALASQKNYMSLYLMGIYSDERLAEWFTKEWKKSGKKLDMGKSCIRFKKADDLALDVIGEAIRKMPAKSYIAQYETAKASAKPTARKAARK